MSGTASSPLRRKKFHARVASGCSASPRTLRSDMYQGRSRKTPPSPSIRRGRDGRSARTLTKETSTGVGILPPQAIGAFIAQPEEGSKSKNTTLARRWWCWPVSGPPVPPTVGSLVFVEMLQIGPRLPFAERHQQAVAADHVLLAADADMDIALGTDRRHTDRMALSLHRLENGPGPGERVIGGGDLVVEDVRVALVEGEALLHHGLAVLVDRQATRVEGARVLEVAGLDLERVVTPVAVVVDPPA